jgi:hypothetical protein
LLNTFLSFPRDVAVQSFEAGFKPFGARAGRAPNAHPASEDQTLLTYQEFPDLPFSLAGPFDLDADERGRFAHGYFNSDPSVSEKSVSE